MSMGPPTGDRHPLPPLHSTLLHHPLSRQSSEFGYTAVFIVPTGINAAIGGYAGDAMPVARALASVADTVVTHPNVMNGASLYWPEPNILYTEGYALDQFAAGRWGLRPVRHGGHRIGLVLDKAMEPDMVTRHLQAAEGARATLGISVTDYAITDEDIGVGIELSPGGASWGQVKRPDTILRAANRLVDEGCTAIAVVARFPDDEDPEMLQAYRQGDGVDCVGGAEAIISHLVTAELQVPCAHAPGLPPLDVDSSISPRSCGEELGYTFLPCVLGNLHRAPTLVTEPSGSPGVLWWDHVCAIVCPASACGGPAVLESLQTHRGKRPVLVVAVEENTTAMKARPAALLETSSSPKDQPSPSSPKGTDSEKQNATQGGSNVVVVGSYLEALGLIAAHKAGINLASLTSQTPSIRRVQ